MESELNKEPTVKRYLLGELSEEEQDQLADIYFNNDSLYEWMLVIENELIESYLRDALSKEDREQFEKRYFSSPSRRMKVIRAKALMESINEQPDGVDDYAEGSGRKRWRWGSPVLLWTRNTTALATLAFLLLIGLAVTTVQSLRLQKQIKQNQAEREALQKLQQELAHGSADQNTLIAQLTEEAERERSLREQLEKALNSRQQSSANANASTGEVVSMILIPGLVRTGSEPQKVKIPDTSKLVRFQLPVEADNDTTYNAVLTLNGSQVWSGDNLKPRLTGSGRAVFVTLPAYSLNDQIYLLTLYQVAANGENEPVNAYRFQVVKK